MSTQYFSINDKIDLAVRTVSASHEKAVGPTKDIHYIVVIDESGSMWNALPKIRDHLKSLLLGHYAKSEKSRISVIGFSGPKEARLIVDFAPMFYDLEVSKIHEALDDLRPRGSTCFVDAFELVRTSAYKSLSIPSMVTSLTFMSDGCDNTSSSAGAILSSIPSGIVEHSAFIAYGYYADNALLQRMAAYAGGYFIFSSNITEYLASFTGLVHGMADGLTPGSTDVEVPGEIFGDLVFGLPSDFERARTNGLAVFARDEKMTVGVPSDITTLFYLVPKADAAHVQREYLPYNGGILLAISAALAERGHSKLATSVLESTRHEALLRQYSSAFGKQALGRFVRAANEGSVVTYGFDTLPPGHTIDPNATTVMDVLQILCSSDNNRLLLDNPAFHYHVTTRPREPSDGALLTMDNFCLTGHVSGYPISRLVFNESRANVSVGVTKQGFVDLSPVYESIGNKNVPSRFPTHIHRNYTIISDGIVNVSTLPCLVDTVTHEALLEAGVVAPGIWNSTNIKDDKGDDVAVFAVLLDLSTLPTINAEQLERVQHNSLQGFYDLKYKLLQAQARAKVINTLYRELVAEENKGLRATSNGLAETYGTATAARLQELGITDNGFAPKTKAAGVSGDTYTAFEVHSLIKGFSSLPSVAEVRKRAAEGKKDTPSSKLVFDQLSDIQAGLYKLTSRYKRAGKALQAKQAAFLEVAQIEARNATRSLQAEISKTVFATVVGRTWFSGHNYGSAHGDFDGNSFSVELKEVSVDL